MGYLFHVTAAFAVLALAEAGADPAPPRALGLLALLALPHALGAAARAAAARGRFRLASLLSAALSACAPIAFALTVLVLGWHAQVTAWSGQAQRLLDWPEPWLLVDLAPFFALEVACADARARLGASGARERGALRLLEVRMLASGALPALVYVLLGSLVSASDELRARVELTSAFGLAYALAMLALTSLALPAFLARALDTIPVPPGGLRALLEHVGARAGFRCREILVWRTGLRTVNAAIVGVTPSSRVVLLTDGLLQRLGPSELAAVYAHEVGHARARHVLALGTWTLASLGALDLLQRALAPLGGAALLGASAVFAAAWYAGFGWLSRRFELEADLASVDLVGRPDALARALEQASGFHGRERRGWRHFSTAERVAFLQANALDPRAGQRLIARLRRWRKLGYALLAVVSMAEALAVRGDFASERVLVDLRLGQYTEAAERLQALASPDPDLQALVRRVEDLHARGGAIAAADLGREATRSLDAGDADAAREWFDLAGIRGDDRAFAAAEAIELALAGSPSRAETVARLRAGPWGAVVAEWIARRAAGA